MIKKDQEKKFILVQELSLKLKKVFHKLERIFSIKVLGRIPSSLDNFQIISRKEHEMKI
jgi:hypothetical protein